MKDIDSCLSQFSEENQEQKSKSVITIQDYQAEKQEVQKVDLDTNPPEFQNDPYEFKKRKYEENIQANKKLSMEINDIKQQEILKWDTILQEVNDLELEELGEQDIQRKLKDFILKLKDQSDQNKK